MESGKIVGFHGRFGKYVDAIGVYAKPTCSSCVPNPINEYVDMPRDPGPWGGSSGKQWADGVFLAVKQIQVHVGKSMNVIHGVQFEYVGRDGRCVWMPKHGGDGG
ncbi:hypothetical protein BUALT_Bualt08G0070600 [Buddleja alternifolia]|uniref:Jacalin-type lectin domain-containing protein n=1 Tax=Buddleja alternifolia TaxID=168488 RepID=A0AAV6X5L1_9LAMI|nr:hypothetical protein BUALT_Bualt08G0070600 [Buddleja alternifolia]